LTSPRNARNGFRFWKPGARNLANSHVACSCYHLCICVFSSLKILRLHKNKIMHCGNRHINNSRLTIFAFFYKTFISEFHCINGRFQSPQKCPTPPFSGNGKDIFSRVVQKSFKKRGFLNASNSVCGSLGVLFCIHTITGFGNNKNVKNAWNRI
jgi:hypothetical protein